MVSSTARAKYSLYNVIIKLTQTENNHNPKPNPFVVNKQITEIRKFGFIKLVDEARITTAKDLESRLFKY